MQYIMSMPDAQQKAHKHACHAQKQASLKARYPAFSLLAMLLKYYMVVPRARSRVSINLKESGTSNSRQPPTDTPASWDFECIVTVLPVPG